MELTYKDAAGRLGNELLYRDDEPRPHIMVAGRRWAFDAYGGPRHFVTANCRTLKFTSHEFEKE